MIVLNLLCLRIGDRDLRYVILGPTEVKELQSPAPLFLGADLLNVSSVGYNNHCRIHARYAKRGLATKIRVPSDVSVGGVNNCSSGAWFYSVQGIFELLFEYHTRAMQLEIIPELMDLWKSDEGSVPNLPEVIIMSLKRLITTSKLHECQLHSPELLTSCRNTMDAMLLFDRQQCEETFGTMAKKTTLIMCDDLLRTVGSLVPICSESDRGLIESVAAFLQLVRAEAAHRDDDLLRSFFDMVRDLAALTTDQRYSGKADGWNLSARQDVFLRVLCEWMGRNMAQFSGAIATKVEEFKDRHLSGPYELPSPEAVLEELFPPCMVLLVGNWMRLYSASAHKEKKCGDIGDHSYSTYDETARRITFSSTALSSRCDHTYVMNELPLRLRGTSAQGCTFNREDHTYVSVRADQDGTQGQVTETSSGRKRRKVARRVSRTCSDILVVLDRSKVPLAQLVLEVANNVLVSGAAHVIYAGLLQQE